MRAILFLYFVLSFFSLNAAVLESAHSFGKRADTLQVDIASIPEPPLSKTKKAFVTDNKFGFDVFKSESNWVTEAFLKDIKPGMTVLDVGSGYGALTRQALDKGAVVISNDVSEKQLLYNLKHVALEKRSQLYLNTQDIRSSSFEPHSLDLIMFHRVLHFFKGDDIEAVLTKAYRWLKPGGKIYIVMMSKDHIAFRDQIVYDSSKKWPGEDLVIVEKHLPEQAYALPQKLHVMSCETLQNHLEKIGFKVEEVKEVALKKVGEQSNRDGREAVGAIGVKIISLSRS